MSSTVNNSFPTSAPFNLLPSTEYAKSILDATKSVPIELLNVSGVLEVYSLIILQYNDDGLGKNVSVTVTIDGVEYSGSATLAVDHAYVLILANNMHTGGYDPTLPEIYLAIIDFTALSGSFGWLFDNAACKTSEIQVSITFNDPPGLNQILKFLPNILSS